MSYDPFRIHGPARISFSGGRTSAYMLWRVLQAHHGELPPDVHVIFANTGKEREETLEFVQECAVRWGVRVRWVEWKSPAWKRPTDEELEQERPFVELIAEAIRLAKDPNRPVCADRYREVTFETASREGEPFEALIAWKQFLPNPVVRFCTQHLKIAAMDGLMHDLVGANAYEDLVGIRADEPRRVAKQRSKPIGRPVELPLADAGVTLPDIRSFWKAQSFDLRLEDWEGNCDLCFLKGLQKKVRIIQDRPELAGWWAGLEDPHNRRFRHKSPSYAQMTEMAGRPSIFPVLDSRGGAFTDDDIADCGPCGDWSGGLPIPSTADRSEVAA